MSPAVAGDCNAGADSRVLALETATAHRLLTPGFERVGIPSRCGPHRLTGAGLQTTGDLERDADPSQVCGELMRKTSTDIMGAGTRISKTHNELPGTK